MKSAGSGEVTRVMLLVIVIGLLIAGSFWTLLPFLAALLWATTIVVATWPLLLNAQRAAGGRRAIAVAIMTVFVSAAIVAPIFLVINAILEASQQAPSVVREFMTGGLDPPPAWLAKVPVVGERIFDRWTELAAGGPTALHDAIRPYAGAVARWAMAATGGFSLMIVHLLLTIILIAVLYSTGETAAAGVLAFGYRMGRERGERTIRLAGQAVRSVALGVLVTALVQSILGALGLWITGVPRPVLLAAVMFALGVAQIGPLPILAAAVIWLYTKDAAMWATVLLVWSIPVIALDNVLRPILIRRGVQLPMLLIIAGVIGGLISFGVVGLFIGPVILAATYTLMKDWIAEGWTDDRAEQRSIAGTPRVAPLDASAPNASG